MLIYTLRRVSIAAGSAGALLFRCRLLCFVIAVSALFTTGIALSAATPTTPHRVEVTAKRFGFEPAEITLKEGQPVELVLTSADVPHGIRFHELNVDLHVGKGKQADVTFTPDKTGTFVGHCSVFCGSGHGRMTLTIHVVN